MKIIIIEKKKELINQNQSKIISRFRFIIQIITSCVYLKVKVPKSITQPTSRVIYVQGLAHLIQLKMDIYDARPIKSPVHI